MHLPKGQHLVKDFIDITIEGLEQSKPNELHLMSHYNNIVLTYQTLLDLIDTKVTLNMHCVEGWSVVSNTFEGISINKLIQILKPGEFAYLGLESKGGFKSFVYKEDMENSFVCIKMNNLALSLNRGYPIRFIAPSLYAYKWVKYLYKISFEKEKAAGYWESRGYSDRARVDFQERFKSDQ